MTIPQGGERLPRQVRGTEHMPHVSRRWIGARPVRFERRLNVKTILNKYEALKAALEELGLDAETSRALSLEYRGAYCEVVIGTEWLNYDCYIDRVTGELAGVDTMPQEDPEAFEGDLCAVLLREEEKAA